MLPEAKLIKSEFTIREMYLTDEVMFTKKSLTRWIALALGLISPRESRTIVIDLLDILFESHIDNEPLSTKEIVNKFKEKGLKADDKSIYYHLLRLKEMGLIIKKEGKYIFGQGKLSHIIKQHYYEKFENSFKTIEKALEEREKKI